MRKIHALADPKLLFAIDPRQRYDPLALAKGSCKWCKGEGIRKTPGLLGRGSKQWLCKCIKNKMRAEEKACRDKWERLYLDCLRAPHYYPPFPCLRSSMGFAA